ncbi:MAG: glycosyltransferase family 4 protein [Aureispira sp.]|nr:glycosyltransferase family 4 protein [Aureispira sp.]
MKKKILFLGIHRKDRSPSQRFRFEQYLDYLEENGFQCEFSNIIRAEDDKVFYGAGNFFGKLGILMRSISKRWKESARAKDYDIVFVQRECFMLGTTFFEKRFAKKTKLVFDFDDSIWLQVVSANNKSVGFLKDADKTAKLIEMSDMVFAGNPYLANYASKYNKNVKIVPTTIDTEEYVRVPQEPRDRVCVGWSGSFTTIEHFEHCLPALAKLKEKYGDKVYFKVIGDGNYKHEELGIQGIPWTKKDELKELSEIEIGLMPLPNDEWTNGKCGLKGLQYMALDIPTIMSPVGVNTEIIQDGENGLLADGVDEWVEKISMLIDNPELRETMGKKGRKTVVDQYSVISERDNYVKHFNELLSKES